MLDLRNRQAEARQLIDERPSRGQSIEERMDHVVAVASHMTELILKKRELLG